MDVERLAQFLEESNITVSRVLHSGKLRAEQTAMYLSRALFPSGVMEASQMMAPNDCVTTFAQQVGDWNADVLLVGHLPFMDKLVAKLIIGDETGSIVNYLPGTVVCLERDEMGLWSILWMLRPDLFSKEYVI